MNENKIRIKQYEQAADERVSLGGIKWEKKWDVCVQCDSREEADRIRTALAQPEPPCKTGSQCIGGKCPQCVVQPEPEPVAWMHIPHDDKLETVITKHKRSLKIYKSYVPLYAAPPQRKWQGLTKEELAEISEFHFHGALSGREFYDDIEAKLKEKNA